MVRVRICESLTSGHHCGQAAFHVGRTAAVQHAVADVSREWRVRPLVLWPGRDYVGVASKHEQRGGCTPAQP